MGRRTRKFMLAAGVAAAMLGFSGTALAQLPSLPGVPQIPDPPPQVMNLVYTAEGTVYPAVFKAALAAEPVATVGGFAIRPECATLSGAAVIAAVAGPSLPVSPFGIISPAFLFCGAAYKTGPADTYLKQADATVGPQLGTEWNTVANAWKANVKPAAASYWSSACIVVSFAPPTSTFPGPARRLHYADLIC